MSLTILTIPACLIQRIRLSLVLLSASLILLAWLPNAFAAQRDLSYFLDSQHLDYVLLGEVHDNGQLHLLRYVNLQNTSRARQQRTTILAMEQFDVSRQADLDQFVAGLSEADRENKLSARKLAEAGGFNFEGWSWTHYENTVHLALRRKWRIVAVNLPRQEAMGIARGGASPVLDQLGLQWSAEESARMRKEIQDGHCGMLPETSVAGMVRAQQSRDALMARSMVLARGSGTNALVILLAGNGHVRKDFGVPRYLRQMDPRARIFAWGFVETPLDEAVSDKVYDEYIGSLPESRPDPCAGLKEHFKNAPSAK